LIIFVSIITVLEVIMSVPLHLSETIIRDGVRNYGGMRPWLLGTRCRPARLGFRKDMTD
jgi:hypothetical protein